MRYCLAEFSPAAINEWVDDEQTALCPHCTVDAVVGFNGSIDSDWVVGQHEKRLG
jgi:hypothetical protein